MVPCTRWCTGLGADMGAYRVGYWEGYTGYGEGYTGYGEYYPAAQPAARGANPTSGAGPGSPAGAGVGGWGAAGALGKVGGAAPGTTLRARSVTLQVPSLSQDP